MTTWNPLSALRWYADRLARSEARGTGNWCLRLEAMRALAEQTLDDGYPFPREHRWWADQAERHARDLIALLDALGDSNWCEDRMEKLTVALQFYADLGPDEVPYADTINDPPDVGRVAREALADSNWCKRL